MTVLTVPLREGAQLINQGSLTWTNVTCFSREGESKRHLALSVPLCRKALHISAHPGKFNCLSSLAGSSSVQEPLWR